ncbi:MAG: hypothetical protein PHW60_15490 [Kiritimatiellae bacterium]|nr:hypothetical protein [Kiritimatiellia bacterium]
MTCSKQDSQQTTLQLQHAEFIDGLRQADDPAPLPQSHGYIAQEPGAGLAYRFPAGTLAAVAYLTMDMLMDGRHTVRFRLALREGENGPICTFDFTLIPQCSARTTIPLAAVNQSGSFPSRTGAFINLKCSGDRVDLAKVDRFTFVVGLKTELPARWCMTPICGTNEMPPPIRKLTLPKGPLLDELGQSATWDWPGKTCGRDELTRRLRDQYDHASDARLPEGWSRWGGWLSHRFKPTGFFRTHHDGRRWWLADPDGYAFWSTGINGVELENASAAYTGLEKALTWLPERNGPYVTAFNTFGSGQGFSYLKANFMRAFDTASWRNKWGAITLGFLRRFGFNTMGNWSEWRVASLGGMPYVRPLDVTFPHTPCVYRDFPDVFDPAFASDARAAAETLRESESDPAMIGYFPMNEPGWGFSNEPPAAGMLFVSPPCACRRELAEFLRRKYTSAEALSSAWDLATDFSKISEGVWHGQLSAPALKDLAAFSGIMVTRLYDVLCDAFRAVDPNHLNLGIRYCSTTPPDWAVEGMKRFDVFSINWYYQQPDVKVGRVIAERLNMPLLIGEWHYGALDVGLPTGGLRRVRDQAARGDAYRLYLEMAAAQPWCVGAHWWPLYDESAIGRFDGESFNCGFLDVCNRPYEELSRAARASHERLYAVTAGRESPFVKEVWYNVRP